MTRDAYTHGHDAPVLEAHRWRTAANSAAFLVPHLRRGMSLLDVGCGPGTITSDLAALVAPGRVTGVDRAPEALEAARAEARSRGLTNVELVQADAYELPVDDVSVDVVFAHQVLQHLSDPVAALRQMRRVAHPGGLVAARDADYGAMSWYPAEEGLERWRDLYRRAARDNGGEQDAARHLPEWAHRAGLEDLRFSASTWCFATPPDRVWWAGQWADRTLGSAFARQVVAAGQANERDLASIAESWRRWAAEPDGWFVVVHGELLART